MAKAKTSSLLTSISGKPGKKSDIAYRFRFGKQEAYVYLQQDKRAPMTAPQKRSAQNFGQISALASRINKDPQASAEFRAEYLQLDPDNRTQILYRYILSRLNADPELVAKYQYLL